MDSASAGRDRSFTYAPIPPTLERLNMSHVLYHPEVQEALREAARLGVAHATDAFAEIIRTGEIPEAMIQSFCGANGPCVGEDGKPVTGAHSLCLLLEVCLAGHQHLQAVATDRAETWADAHPTLAQAVKEAVKE